MPLGSSMATPIAFARHGLRRCIGARASRSYSSTMRDGVITTPFDRPLAAKVSMRVA